MGSDRRAIEFKEEQSQLEAGQAGSQRKKEKKRKQQQKKMIGEKIGWPGL